jgi:hypothetical protein
VEKVRSKDGTTVDLAGIRRPKGAEKQRFGGWYATWQAPPSLFGQFLEMEFSEGRLP